MEGGLICAFLGYIFLHSPSRRCFMFICYRGLLFWRTVLFACSLLKINLMCCLTGSGIFFLQESGIYHDTILVQHIYRVCRPAIPWWLVPVTLQCCVHCPASVCCWHIWQGTTTVSLFWSPLTKIDAGSMLFVFITGYECFNSKIMSTSLQSWHWQSLLQVEGHSGVARLCIVPVSHLLHGSSGSRHECSEFI